MSRGGWVITGFGQGSSNVISEDRFGDLFLSSIMGFAQTKTREEIERTLQRLVIAAKELCPVKTGALKESITYMMTPGQPEGIFGSDLYYAGFVNAGTSKMEGFHFLEGALDIVKIGNLGG